MLRHEVRVGRAEAAAKAPRPGRSGKRGPPVIRASVVQRGNGAASPHGRAGRPRSGDALIPWIPRAPPTGFPPTGYSPVIRVYAAATARMMPPKRIWRAASGICSTVSSVVRTVRMSAPTMLPA